MVGIQKDTGPVLFRKEGGDGMGKASSAVECFKNGFNCAQAVLASYCEEMGLDKETGLKLACPFGAGISRTDNTCGAVIGAIMVIGLKYGKYLPDDNEAKEKTYKLTQDFISKFKEMYGTVQCSELIKFNLSKEKDYIAAKEYRVFETLCPCYVEDAVKILEDMLTD